MSTRTSGYTFGVLPEAAEVVWAAQLPANGLSVALPPGLLTLGRPAMLTAMTLPTATTLRLSLTGAGLSLGYRRDLTLDLGGALTIHFADAVIETAATEAGLDIDLTLAGIPTGRNLRCALTRTRPSYLLQACQDRLDTYRGFQLWNWTYGSRIEDFLGTTAALADVRREFEQTFQGIAEAEIERLEVTQPDKFRYDARVSIDREEVTVGV